MTAQYQISAPVFSIKLIKNRLSVKYAPVVTALSCRGRTSTCATLFCCRGCIPPPENLTFSLLSAVQRFLQGWPGDLRGLVPPATFLPLWLHRWYAPRWLEAESSSLLCHSRGPLTVPHLSVTFSLSSISVASAPLLGWPPLKQQSLTSP